MAEGGYIPYSKGKKGDKQKKAENENKLNIYFPGSSDEDDGPLTDTSSLRDDDCWDESIICSEDVLLSLPPPKPPRVPKYLMSDLDRDLEEDYQAPIWPPLLAPTDTRGRIISRTGTNNFMSGPHIQQSINTCKKAQNTQVDTKGILNTNKYDFENYSVIDSPDSEESDTSSRGKDEHMCQFPGWIDVHLDDSPKHFNNKNKPKFHLNSKWNVKKLSKSSAGKGLGKLGSKFTSMKDLSGNLKHMLNIKDIDRGENSHEEESIFIPIDIIKCPYPPLIKHACMLHLEGTMGVGKSTLIRHLDSMLTENTVATFLEPMTYWKFVYTDVIGRIYKATKPHRAGRDSTSAEILSCQMKFLTPFKCIKSAINRLCKEEEKKLAPLDNWIVFDRHIISPTLVFPYMFLRRGLLSFEAFVSIISCFSCQATDVVVLLNLDEDENVMRITKRNRPLESVSKRYIQDLNVAYNAVYCSWLLLQHFQPSEIVELCLSTLNLLDLCANKVGSGMKLSIVEKLFNQSFFFGLRDVLNPFKHNCTVIEICMRLCEELKKIQFIVVNASEFTDDLCGLWTSIYMQTLNNPAIKTRAVDWSNLTLLSREYNCQ